MLWKKSILGVEVTNATEEKILEYIFNLLQNTQKKVYIVTPNPEIIMYAQAHTRFKEILNKAEVALCDGVGILIASYLLRTPLKQRIAGVDFMKKLCEKSRENAVTIGLLGGKAGVAERTQECLERMYPGIRIVFAGGEWTYGSYKTHKSNKSDQRIDILFVAFGHPKQEEWIAENLDSLPIRVMMGVGGAFDYISGDVPRAPRLVRSLGGEWLYRLMSQPWRWRRQIALMKFAWLVAKEIIKVTV